MKLLFLLLFPVTVFAQVLVTPNKGGGEIVLTDRPCVYQGKNHDKLRAAYTWSPSSNKSDGCWVLQDGKIHVIYFETANVKVYDLEVFQARQ